MRYFIVGLFLSVFSIVSAQVQPGVEVFFNEKFESLIKDKKIGLITNHTGVDSALKPTIDIFKEQAKEYKIVALFSPEHGINGQEYAWTHINNSKDKEGLPIYSLHGSTRRPTKEMLKDIDVLIFDIQDIGSRSYTYLATLLMCIEEAAKNNISLIVLDRPNPINGLIVDGPMLEDNWKSFIGYVNVPYCHGMTIGEIAKYFNEEYKVGCNLTIVPMRGWKRSMSYEDTKLPWVPTSPYIPEDDTPFFTLSTGILGELKIVNIGIGYTLPFKIVGAPWIDAKKFADKLNEQNLAGVKFLPFHFKPFYGLYKKEDCHGVKIIITDKQKYQPLSVQYLLMGILKSLYPDQFLKKLDESSGAKKLFCQANGTEEIYKILKEEKYPAWKMIEFNRQEREKFLQVREKYLIKEYSQD